MGSTYNKEKILESMFDPDTSEILAELEDGGKELSYLMDKLQIFENSPYALTFRHSYFLGKKEGLTLFSYLN